MSEMQGFLSSKTGPVPLTGVRVQGDILGRGARVKISQRFRNQEEMAVEAVYRFPLPEGAAVCGFMADIDGRKIKGDVEDRDKAFEIYDKALEKGDGGYLLDQERPNIFTVSVGNLNPASEAVIEIEYVTLLDMTGNHIRFFLPTTISPRYIPGDISEEGDIPETDKIHPPYSENVPYGLSVFLNIHKGGLLKSINSPGHPIQVDDLKGDPVKISFAVRSVRMDRDFILNMEYEALFAGSAYQWRDGQETFLQLDLLPVRNTNEPGMARILQEQTIEREIIFLLDCSGSMSGDSIHEAKKALEICLRGLDPASTFTVYCFGSDYHFLFKEPEKYSEQSLEKGLDYLKNITADLGGTEILNPLRAIYSACKGNIEKNIILLTDGEVSNEAQIFELVREHRKTTRVFTIGIGAGCNEYFIKGMARAGMGDSELIYPGERIEPKVLALFNRIIQKSLKDISIHWGDGIWEQAPANPAIFFETPVTLFARCENNPFSGRKVIITGNVSGKKEKWEIDIADSDHRDIPVSTLWAREKIRDLEENRNVPEKMKKAILALSKKYHILSRFTSYVAVEERKEKDKTTGELILRRIPVPLTIGWHGAGSVWGQPMIMAMSAPLPAQVMESSRLFRMDRTMRARLAESLPPDDVFKKVRDDSEKSLIPDILNLQQPGGGLLLNYDISQKIGVNFNQLKRMAHSIEITVAVDKFLLLSTAVILRILEGRFSSEYGIWSGIVRKSRDWMTGIIKNGDPVIEGMQFLAWVEKFVQEINETRTE